MTSERVNDAEEPEISFRVLLDAAVNNALERAAKAVYDSRHVWTDRDQLLYDAAERVRACKRTADA